MKTTKAMLHAAFIAFIALASLPAAAALEIHFESTGVRVAGSTRGGRVACIFVDRAPLVSFSGSTVIADAANKGEVLLDVRRQLTDRTVFVAVDLESGEFAAATPQGTISNVTFHGHSFRLNGGELKQLESHDLQQLDFLLVRPHAGAWAFSGSDGGAGDSDGQQDHTFLLDVGSLKPLQSSFGPPPKKFDKGDVAVILDPLTGDVFMAGVK